MYGIIISILCLALSTVCAGQQAQRVMIAGHADLIKSDNVVFLDKVQGGFEGSYYLSRKLAVSTGIEWWTDSGVILIPGLRLCPIDEAFLRIRGLIGKDLSIGGGFAKPLSGKFRIEATGDLYFQGHIAIRAGVAYGFGRTP